MLTPFAMTVAVTGATGLVGSALTKHLQTAGYRVRRVLRPNSRTERTADDVTWDPDRNLIDVAGLADTDVVVHLAGEGIADKPWTAARKKVIVDSRVRSTRLIADAMLRLPRPPSVFVGASAVGIYGNRGDEELDETSLLPPAGEGGFLADTGFAWEAASASLDGLGIRRVMGRIGIVLAKEGGAIAKMLPPFRLGLGGVIGSGQQWMSWIALDDLVAALEFAIHTSTLSGAVNLVAPMPSRNRDFVHELGRALRRPTVVPLPSFAVRTLFGEMGQETLLGGQRVHPRALEAAGFSFRWPSLRATFDHMFRE